MILWQQLDQTSAEKASTLLPSGLKTIIHVLNTSPTQTCFRPLSGSDGLRHPATVAPDIRPGVGPRDPAGVRRHREAPEEGRDEGR